jgi:hypothetical protein
MKLAVEIASCSMIYVPSFMKIGIGVQTIFRFLLITLRGCNVGVSDGRDFYNYAVEMD